MKVIKITELSSNDEYFYPICNIGYYSYSNERNHLFIMMSDGRNKTSYSMEKFRYEITDL